MAPDCVTALIEEFKEAAESFKRHAKLEIDRGDLHESTISLSVAQAYNDASIRLSAALRRGESTAQAEIVEMPRSVLVGLAGDDPAKQQLLAAWDRENELRHAAEASIAALKAGHLRQVRTYQDAIDRLSSKDGKVDAAVSSDIETPALASERERRPSEEGKS